MYDVPILLSRQYSNHLCRMTSAALDISYDRANICWLSDKKEEGQNPSSTFRDVDICMVDAVKYLGVDLEMKCLWCV